MDERAFALFFVGLCLLVAGTAGYAVTFDQDWRVTAFGDPDATGGVAYETLDDRRRATVDRALADASVRTEERTATPPGLVEKDGTIYAFKVKTIVDFQESGHPLHYPALGVAVLGLLSIVEAMRRDHAPHWRPWRRLVPSGDDR